MKNKKVCYIVNTIVLVALVATAIVSVAMGGCTKEIECTSGTVPMKCHWTFIAVPFILVPGIVASLCYYALKERLGRQACSLVATTCACMAVCLISFGIGTCSADDMHCQTTAMVVEFGCLVATTLSLALTFTDRRAGKDDKPKMKI